MKMKILREEYLNKSIKHCNEVIREFKKELSEENDEYVKEIIIEVLKTWEDKKKIYLSLISSKMQ